MKITLLDDEFSLRNNIKDFLEFHHYEVEAYADGTSLLEKTNFDSDLYILDINVPGASGYEVMEWISNNSPHSPVIFITAYTDIKSIAKYVLNVIGIFFIFINKNGINNINNGATKLIRGEIIL